MPELSPSNTSKLDISKELGLGEVANLIKRLPNRKAHGPDQVGNEAFKLALPVILPYLCHFLQACLNLDYHPVAFRHALTVVLPKPGKKSYNAAKSWRPVALLSCAGKMLEKIVANRVKELLMNNPGLCPVLQFGSPGKSTTHALEYITNWVYRSWQMPAGGNADHTSLLSLDISGAYDNVRREELLQRLVDKGFPDWIVRIVWSFLSERSTELLMPGHRSQKFWVNIGIPQGSPLSPILFILFAAPILESFDNYELKTGKGKKVKRKRRKEAAKCVFSVMSYVDDTNFLEEMRILGVIFDRHLRWDAHIENLRLKVSKMLGYHTRISGSTWGPSLIKMRRLYISKMRSIIAYASPAWFIPQHNTHDLGLTKARLKKFEALQNQCLVKVAGAYSKTDRMVLRKELNISSMEHYIGLIGATYRMKNIGSAYMDALEKAQHGERNRKWNYQNPYILLYGEAKRALQAVKAQYTKKGEHHERIWEQMKQPGSIPDVAKLIKEYNAAQCATRCEQQWDTYVRENVNNRTYGALGASSTTDISAELSLYSGSDRCPCKEGRHTVEHLFMQCPRLTEKRLKLAAEVKEFRLNKLLTCDAKAASRWAILNFGLDQFSWPREELMAT
ncbi:unnamed protein product [Clonostachys solani]|uniref:Reverse transcriptase domain-containing protein n=1 Tax=Clonostachys solani TaxID=160281 RepID=A0A9N9ZJ97_9HYPO|nr:unnamed protein product [Clonostachys solani]